jgi:hypothetical protein
MTTLILRCIKSDFVVTGPDYVQLPRFADQGDRTDLPASQAAQRRPVKRRRADSSLREGEGAVSKAVDARAFRQGRFVNVGFPTVPPLFDEHHQPRRCNGARLGTLRRVNGVGTKPRQ